MLALFKLIIVFANTFGTFSLFQTNKIRVLSLSVYIFFMVYFGVLFVLATGLMSNNFQMIYVNQHSHPQLPWYFKIASLWAGHEGAMSLILLFMACHTLISFKTVASQHQEKFLKYSLINLIAFSLYALFHSYPLETQLSFITPAPQDLNPILKHYALTYHPPLLLYGIISFFPISLAWLLEGSTDSTHKKIYLGLGVLTLGITFGSYWAYHVLGWGGWWFWDPVETISLFPCFMGMAMLHGKNKISKFVGFLIWPVILIGFFLTRTDAISSVHSFSQQPLLGHWVFSTLFINLVIGVKEAPSSISLDVAVFQKLRGLCTVGLYIMTILGLGSLLLPILLNQLSIQSIFVGPGFYNQVLGSILCGLLTLIVTKRFCSTTTSWILGSLVFFIFAWPAHPFFLSFILLILFSVSLTFRSTHGSLSHQLSLLLLFLISLQSVLKIEEDYLMTPNETKMTSWGNVTLVDQPEESISNYESTITGKVHIAYRNGPSIEMKPFIKIHESQNTLTAELATYPHVYWETGVILMKGQKPNTWIIKYYFKPFLRVIWLIALLMGLLWCFRGIQNERIE